MLLSTYDSEQMMQTQQIASLAEHGSAYENTCVEPAILLDLPAAQGMSGRKMLISPSLHFDGSRVNRSEARVNTKGDLVNQGHQKNTNKPPDVAAHWFQKYRGTCTTRPIQPTGCPQYWEVRSKVLLHGPITNITFTLFELGFSSESELDRHPSLRNSASSVVFQVIRCAKDNRICMRVVVDRRELDHIKTKIEIVANKAIFFKHGILYGGDSGKLGFVDVNEKVLMTVLEHVDVTRMKWPMFGVCNGNVADIKLKLITGSQINFSDEMRRVVEQELMR